LPPSLFSRPGYRCPFQRGLLADRLMSAHPIFQAHDGMGGAARGRHVASKCGVDTADQL